MSTEPHILVIDDEPQILRALRTILTAKKFRVTTASRGEEGLALAATALPDLVILDLGSDLDDSADRGILGAVTHQVDKDAFDL